MAAIHSRCLVTAFSPFGGRSRNASLLALRGLKDAAPWIRTRVLPVDSVLAPIRLRRAIRDVLPTILLMLGEAGGSRVIRLETSAWNELDFRIPDAAGRQPQGVCIHADAPDRYQATLPVERLRDVLVESGHDVALSDDPGRYLCNQVFFEAMHSLGQWSVDCAAGFVHVPLEMDYPTSRSVAALVDMLGCLRR